VLIIVYLIPGHQDHSGGSFLECLSSKSLPYPTASSCDLQSMTKANKNEGKKNTHDLKSLQRPTHRYSHHYMLPLDAVSPSEGEEIYHRYQGGQPEQKPPQHFTCAGKLPHARQPRPTLALISIFL